MLLTSLLAVASSALLASASGLRLQQATVSVISSEGSTLASHSIDSPKGVSSPLELLPLSTIKLAFQILDDESGEGVIPHQTHLSFVDVNSGLDEVLPVTVRSNGKAKFEIDTASVPKALLTSSGTFTVTLTAGSLSVASPISQPLFTFALPQSILLPPTPAPASELIAPFHKQPLISHTFRADEKPVNALVSAVGTAAVWAPWLLLAGLVSNLGLRYSSKGVAAPFLATLVALEASIGAYWIGYVKLFRFLAIFGALGVVAFFTGRTALRNGVVPK